MSINKTPGKTMPARWEDFCRAYVGHNNATRAAIEAGFSPAAAGVQGSQMLARPQIKERINQLRTPKRNAFEASRDRVLEELCRIAYADPGEMFDADGRMKPIHEMAEHVRATIGNFEEETRFDGRGDEVDKVTTKKIKAWDKMKALEMLAKHLQLYTDAPSIQVNTQVNIQELRGLSERERELLRELAESRARTAEGHAALPGPTEG